MRVVRSLSGRDFGQSGSLSDRALQGPVVTVGSFDGVHLGHRALLDMVVALARERGVESVVVTFDPHPRRITGGEAPDELTSVDEKALLLSDLGVDCLVVVPFTEEFRSLPPEAFVRDILVGQLGAGTLVVGYNHLFGRDKQGGFELLRHMQSELGFEVYELPRQEADGHKVSSTVIRELIARGDMTQAARLLGHPYGMLGEIVNFVTILTDSPYKLLPPNGLYPVDVDGRQATLVVSDNGLQLSEKGEMPNIEKILITFL